MSHTDPAGFAQLGLSDAVLRAVYEVGYETPSPIQAAAIGPLLEGHDIIGQAQTGTGKTAAFALPLLSRLDLAAPGVQILVLAPTRELAIQVAEALQTYARYLDGFHVLPVYGGQSYSLQLRPLRRGVHAVVGTPGRVLDHVRRGTLVLNSLKALVLDEADEMLRMGFAEEVGAILEATPVEKQVALFSATMPRSIRAIAEKHTRSAQVIRIETETATVASVSQHYWQVSGIHKLDALTRFLETRDFDGMIVFVRTKLATTELADRLEARGFSSAPLNGDMNQATRELTIERLKTHRLDILVATDVAARGLDVDRISHVVNYDIPYDTEAYVHRIGRTARAGRGGEAILFVAPREQRMLRSIERATGQAITPLKLPSAGDVVGKRAERLKDRLRKIIESEDLGVYENVVREFQAAENIELDKVAAALAFIAQGDRPLTAPAGKASREEAPRDRPQRPSRERPSRDTAHRGTRERAPREFRESRDKPARGDARPSPRRDTRDAPEIPAIERDRPAFETGGPDFPKGPRKRLADADATRYRIEVGSEHGVEPKHIVGAIANEAGLDSTNIGAIDIKAEHSTVDLPSGMPREIFKHLRKVWVKGRQLNISEEGGASRGGEREARPGKPKKPKSKEKHAKRSKDKDKGKRSNKAKQARPDSPS